MKQKKNLVNSKNLLNSKKFISKVNVHMITPLRKSENTHGIYINSQHTA